MLIRAEHPGRDHESDRSSVKSRRALWALIGFATFLRLIWAANVGAAFDEPYYFQYIQHPALSYFDHPPMVALVGKVGLLVAGDAFSVFGLRLGFIILFAGSTWLIARLTARFYGLEGRVSRGPRLERLRLLWDGGCHDRPAGRSTALLLALDSRPTGRRP